MGDVVTSVQGQGIFDRKLKIQKEDGVDELDCVDAAIRPAEYKAENSAGFGNERESLFPRMERELDELKNLFTRLLASESVHRPSDVGGVIGLTESTIQQEGGLDGDVATGRPAEYKAENSAGFGNEIEPLFTRMEGDLDELKNSFTRLCTSEGEHKASYVEGVIDLAKSTASTLDNFNLIISSIDSKDSNKENIKFTESMIDCLERIYNTVLSDAVVVLVKLKSLDEDISLVEKAEVDLLIGKLESFKLDSLSRQYKDGRIRRIASALEPYKTPLIEAGVLTTMSTAIAANYKGLADSLSKCLDQSKRGCENEYALLYGPLLILGFTVLIVIIERCCNSKCLSRDRHSGRDYPRDGLEEV
ncbi:hypothetical protein [Endozoicomonas sp.]|uniref:hypothetical protein n=1 Tax=Endozoicomonas sp. TaxID=1892382 RepID=UPI003AF8B1ED